MHTLGFLCLGLFNTDINNHISNVLPRLGHFCSSALATLQLQFWQYSQIFPQSSPTLPSLFPGAMLLPSTRQVEAKMYKTKHGKVRKENGGREAVLEVGKRQHSVFSMLPAHC